MNYHFKNIRCGKSLFVGMALMLSSCAALPSVINSSPLISSSTSQAPGRTWQDRIMNAYVADGSDSQGLAHFKRGTVNSSGTYDTCVSLGSCTLASITIPSP